MHQLDRLGPVEVFQLVGEAVAVGRDAEQPLAQRGSFDGMAAAFALTVDDLFVGEDRPQRGAPVDGGLVLIGQSVLVLIAPHRLLSLRGDIGGDRQLGDRPPLARARHAVGAGPRVLGVVPCVEQLQENPLRPAVIVGVGRGELARPVVAEAERLQLPLERLDVLRGRDGRMSPRPDGVLFGGEAKRIPAHRMEHLLASHPTVPADDVSRRVALGMPHMQPGPRRIREHVQHIHLRFRGIDRAELERAVLIPESLPLGFNSLRIESGHGES